MPLTSLIQDSFLVGVDINAVDHPVRYLNVELGWSDDDHAVRPVASFRVGYIRPERGVAVQTAVPFYLPARTICARISSKECGDQVDVGFAYIPLEGKKPIFGGN
jgi:hypothetical protein